MYVCMYKICFKVKTMVSFGFSNPLIQIQMDKRMDLAAIFIPLSSTNFDFDLEFHHSPSFVKPSTTQKTSGNFPLPRNIPNFRVKNPSDFPGVLQIFPSVQGGETTWALGNFFGSQVASIAPMAARVLWEEDSWEEDPKISRELQGLALWAYACKWDFKARLLLWRFLEGRLAKNGKNLGENEPHGSKWLDWMPQHFPTSPI